MVFPLPASFQVFLRTVLTGIKQILFLLFVSFVLICVLLVSSKKSLTTGVASLLWVSLMFPLLASEYLNIESQI